MATPTYRQIAKLANVSLAAVSYALRNRPEASAEMRARVQAAARKIGYKPNPMVTALMTNQRKGHLRRTARAIIVQLMSAQAEKQLSTYISRHALSDEIRAICEDAGFLFERLRWDDFGESPRKLFAALRTRRTAGVIFCETIPQWALAAGWDDYALVSQGSALPGMPCHYTCIDHHLNVLCCIERLTGLGYRKIGFAMARTGWIDRDRYRALSAYLGWMTQAGTGSRLAFWSEQWQRDIFLEWVRKQKPEVIIAVQHEPLEYLRSAGYRIPEDIGFAHFDLDPDWSDLAGIRQNYFENWQATAHLLIEQINLNARGIPKHQHSISITSDWVDGPSVRRITRPHPSDNVFR